MRPDRGSPGDEPPPDRRPSVLLITGDRGLPAPVGSALGSQGFALSCERHAGRGAAALAGGRHCAALLDAAVSDDVPELVRHVRRRSAVPIIVIAAQPEPADAVALLESGADDCVGSRVEPAELVARVRAVLRRGRPAGTDVLEIGGIRIEPAARRVRLDDRPLTLTTVEYDLLECLARAAGRIVSRDELTAWACGREPSPLDRALDVHVSHLRRKLAPCGGQVVTVRGAGYMLRP